MSDEPTRHDSDAIIERVLGDLLVTYDASVIRKGSRRAVLVLDPSTAVLASALRDANFWALTAPSGMSLADFETTDFLLPGRIVVTANTREYIDDAPALDYAVIGLDALAVIDQRETYRDNATVRLISWAVTRHRLASRPPAWVVMLVPEGEHALLGLE